MVKVVKFGGSSLASAEQFKKVSNIIKADESRRYVVPSAPGKRFSDDTKVTDMLYKCYLLPFLRLHHQNKMYLTHYPLHLALLLLHFQYQY